jgi:hypothetical protein
MPNAQKKLNMRLIAFTISKLSGFRKTLLTIAMFLLTSLIQPPSEAQEPQGQTPEIKSVDPLIPFARRWDINGDRIFTCEEWRLFTFKVFQRADRNHNKVLEESEMSEVIAADGIFFDSSLSYFDTDNDGVVARDEFIERPNPFFFAYDADKDCRVTESEENAVGK